jgi:hypothetical protein
MTSLHPGSTAAWLLVFAALSPWGCDGDDDDASASNSAPSVALIATIDEQVSTTVHLDWTVAGVDLGSTVEAYVEVGPDEGYGTTLPATPTGDEAFTAHAWGLLPLTTYHARASVSAGDDPVRGTDVVFTTGGVPTELPTVTMTADDPAAASPGWLVTTLLTDGHRPVILDTDGTYRWWGTPADAHVTVVRARLARDGHSVITLAEDDGYVIGEHYVSELRWTPLDGGEVTSIAVDDAHHDFVERPDGTVAVITRTFHEHEGEWIAADAIVEVEPDGTERQVWSAWEAYEYDLSVPTDEQAFDWTHANALDLDEDDDRYLLTLRHLDAIVAIDRATGAVAWQLGGADSDFTMDGDEALDWFRQHHQFEQLDGGMLVFDNGQDEHVASRVIEYTLGETTVTPVWRYVSDPPTNCYALGDVTRLESGNTLITWSTSGLIEEVTPDRAVVRRLSVQLGAGFGYTTWIEARH